MSDSTVTIRGVDAKTWKEFQKSIVSLHGNLYGNIGQELTSALKFWLERYRGREAAVFIPSNRLSVSYDDIGGLKEEIKMIKETVEMPLKHPELFRWLNLVPPKGVLIQGPPGTGKNILARAATAEAKAQLYVLSMQRVMCEPYESRLRGVFQRAKETTPSVILIPDLAAMESNRQKIGGEAVEQVLSWLLSEMDAVEDFSRVIVIGIVHSPEELDPSLRQKFQREISVGSPNKQGRLEILKIITSKMPLAEDVDLEKLSDATDQLQGIHLWKICQEAAARALRQSLEHEKINDEKITHDKLERIKIRMDDFLQAIKSTQRP